MGDNNVASIGKMLMQTQSGQSVTGVDGADIGTTFRKMVDQMTQIPGSSVSTGSQTAQNMQQLTFAPKLKPACIFLSNIVTL